MQAVKKDGSTQAVCDWSPVPAKLNSMFSRVARQSLPSAPASRTFSQDTLRRWQKSFREHAAGLSRCLTKVQDFKVTQLKSLWLDSSKGKSAERTQQAVEEYLVTFNQSISQAMQRTIQDLSEGVFISMANLNLARRDSYLEFQLGGVKPDIFTALRTFPVHQFSLFPDRLLVKAEDEISRSEERRSVGNTQRKPGRFHPYVPSSGRSSHRQTGNPLHRLGSKLETGKLVRKVVVKPQASPKSRPRDLRSINDNYCVSNIVRLKDFVDVSDKMEGLNPPPVTNKSETVFLHVNSFVPNVRSVTGLPIYPGAEHLEHLSEHGVVQDGDPRDNKDLPTGRGVGHLNRL